MGKIKPVTPELPFNNLPPLPPEKKLIETLPVLRQLVKSSVVLAELKGLANTLPNPQILLNAVILKEARASSEIENVITTQDKHMKPCLQKLHRQMPPPKKCCATGKPC